MIEATCNGISVNPGSSPIDDGTVELQFVSEGETYHDFRVPMRDALYLANALLEMSKELKLDQFVGVLPPEQP